VPSVILLDIMMPIMDGFTFLDRIRSDRVWSRIPVVVLTAAHLSAADISRLEQLSAAILIKGRDATEMVVASILETARIIRTDAVGVTV
jgi:CheY-like chemotaxis protein